MSTPKLEKLLEMLNTLRKNKFKVSSKMRAIGIENESFLIHRIFIDITSDAVIEEFIKRQYASTFPVMQMAFTIDNLIDGYPIKGEYLKNIFKKRLRLTILRSGIERNIYPSFFNNKDIEIKAQSVKMAKAEMDGIYLPGDITHGSTDESIFYSRQSNVVQWEDLMGNYHQTNLGFIAKILQKLRGSINVTI
jgi:hypothetical protein